MKSLTQQVKTFTILSMAVLASATGYAADTGWVLASTVTQTSNVGNPWTNITNLTADDANAASCAITFARDPTDVLWIRWDWTAYSGTITGIEMKYRRNTNNANDIKESTVGLTKGGVITTGDKTDTATYWSTALETITKGSTTDLWGQTGLTFGDDLGIKFIALDKASGSGDTPRIEAMWMRITYTPSAPSGPSIGAASAGFFKLLGR